MTKGINIYSGLFNSIKVTSNKSKTESIHTSKDSINTTKRGTARGLGVEKAFGELGCLSSTLELTW